jgi:scyllo-inositol 2-dehydrogenase (NADP+)
MPDTFNVGLAGYGLAGRVFHAQLIVRTPGLKLAGVFSRTEEKRAQAAREYQDVKTSQTYEALLADPAIHVVVVATPHDVHEPMVIEAAAAAKHVITDKIMAMTSAAGERMIAACRKAGVVFSVFQNRRWDSDYLTFRRVLERGLLGEVFSIDSAVTNYRNVLAQRDGGTLPATPARWRDSSERGGGPLHDWGAHLFDQALELCGTRVEAVWGDLQYRVPALDVETSVDAVVRFAGRSPAGVDAEAPAYAGTRQLGDRASEGGIRFTIETGWTSTINPPRWYARGSLGTYVQFGTDPQVGKMMRGEVGPQLLAPGSAPRLVQRAGPDATEREVPVEVLPGSYLEYYASLVKTLRGEAPLAVEPESVLRSVRLIEAVVESAQRDAVVHPDLR